MSQVITSYDFHRYANLFPMMQEAEFASLVEDIGRSGLREKIWLFQGQILDGRNRYLACERSGVMPQFRTFTGTDDDALQAVLSWNLERRHLSSSQKAAIAVELEDLFSALEAQARERQREYHGNQYDKDDDDSGLVEIFPQVQHVISAPVPKTREVNPTPAPKTRDRAADAMGTNGRYISDAKKLKSDAPNIHAKVKDGDLTLPIAKQVASLPAEQQEQVLAAVAQEDDKEKRGKVAKQAVQRVTLEQAKAKEKAAIAAAPDTRPVLWQCDAIDWLKKQEPYDLLLTDPPYSTDVDDVAAFAESWLPIALSKLKPTGRAYVCVGAYPEELHAYLSVAMPDQVLVWTYRNTLGPSPKDNYKLNWQAILYYKGSAAGDLDCPVMLEQFSVQDINAPDGRQGDRFHAWQKPLELAERFIRHSTKPGDVVADPFACTGTFAIAAAKLGRVGLGCDISTENLAIAEARGCQVLR